MFQVGQISGTVRQYAPSEVLVQQIFLTLPQACLGELQKELASHADREDVDGAVYRVVQNTEVTYIGFSRDEVCFGHAIKFTWR